MDEQSIIQSSRPKLVAGGLIIAGILVSLVLVLANPSPLEIVAAFALLVVIPFFLIRPKTAFLLLLIVRPAVDFIGQNVSVTIEDLGSLNVNSIIGIFIFVWGATYLLVTQARFFKIPFTYFFAALSIVTAVSISFSIFPFESFGEWIRITNYLILFLLGYNFLTTKSDFLRIVRALYLSTIIPILFGLYQVITQTGIADEASSNRIFGTFAHPALFGHYLAFIALLVIAGILTNKEYRKQLYAFLGALLLMLLLTYTRGAWLFFGYGFIMFGLFFFRHQLLKIMLGLSLATVVILSGALYLDSYTSYQISENALFSRVINSVDIDPEGSIAWRLRFWQDTLEPSGDFFFQGYGAGAFIDYAEKELNNRFDAHNDYLKIYIELGIFGLTALVVLYGYLLIKSITLVRQIKKKEDRVYAVTYFILISGLILISIFDNLYQNTTLFWLFFALVGSYFSYSSSRSKKHTSTGMLPD
ncbi:O-antigen ligase family protein [Patescibacteria group bacterium]